jgi:hypothetical protein
MTKKKAILAACAAIAATLTITSAAAEITKEQANAAFAGAFLYIDKCRGTPMQIGSNALVEALLRLGKKMQMNADAVNRTWDEMEEGIAADGARKGYSVKETWWHWCTVNHEDMCATAESLLGGRLGCRIKD